MALETVTTINTTNIDLSSDLTNGLFSSSALTLGSDFVNLTISADGVAGGAVTIYITASNDGTTYVELEKPEGNYRIPIKKTLTELDSNGDGTDMLAVNGLDYAYAKVHVFAPDATAGTITIKANH